MAVNLSFIGGAGWQFFDDNGNPLSGGKIYTYAAGTTTPLSTYTSRDGLTPNANPIILDAAGRTPQEIWSTEGLLYKYVVRTSTDVLIRSWDNIGGSVVSSDLAQDLASTTNNAKGDALVGFRQSSASGFLTGAVGLTVNDKLQESLSVKDFGAVGDGVTDDTAAILAAVNAANALGINLQYTGSNVFVNGAPSVIFPRGVYRINSTIALSVMRALTLEGNGKVLLIGDTSTNKTVTAFTGSGMRYLTVKNIQFQNFNTVFNCSTLNLDFSSWTFDKVQVETVNCFVDTGTYATSRSTTVSFRDCVFQYNVVRIARAFVDNISLYGCWIGSGTSSTSTFYVNSLIEFYGCVFVPTGTNTGGRCWVYFTNDDGAGGIANDSHRGVAFHNSRFSNEAGNCPAVVCDYPVNNNIFATPSISISGCVITGFQPAPFDAGNTECGFVYLKQYPAGVSFSGCSFYTLGSVYGCLVAKVDSLSSIANDIFSVDIDDMSFNNAMRNVGENSSYRIARSLRGYIRNPDPYTYRGIHEDGFLPVVASGTTGVMKSTFTINTGYGQIDFKTPIQFILHVSGFNITGGSADFNYAGASSYIVTLDGFYGGSPNAQYSRLRFTKIHGGAFGLFDASNADIVSLHFGSADTGSTTIAVAASHTVTCTFGTACGNGIARIVPLTTKRTRYSAQMSG